MLDQKPQKFLSPDWVPMHRRAPRWYDQFFPRRSKEGQKDQNIICIKPDDPAFLGRIGSLEARLAQTPGELRRAQQLRFSVFYEEMSAQASPKTSRSRRDADEYDPLCDHIIVVDHAGVSGQGARPEIVGTYRMLPGPVAQAANGFYSATEFDLKPILIKNWDKNFCEVGRSCVLAPYRERRTMEVLWMGLWAYAALYKIDVYFGAASFQGTDLTQHQKSLDLLHEIARAPQKWQVHARKDVGQMVDYEVVPEAKRRLLLNNLPPLIKGYLRIGAFFGDGVFVDQQFDTTDVMAIALLENAPQRYKQHFARLTGLSL